MTRENDSIADTVELKNREKADTEIVHARGDKRPEAVIHLTPVAGAWRKPRPATEGNG